MSIIEDIGGGLVGGAIVVLFARLGLKSEQAETDLSKMGTAKTASVKAPSNRAKATKAIADEINAIKGKLHDTKDEQVVVAAKVPPKKTTTPRTPRTPAAKKVATSS
jgi:hypothetical protein